MYNKKSTNKYLDIPVILSYFWNGSKNIITGKIKSNDYFLIFKKIESNNTIKVRYSQIDNIGLMPEIPESMKSKVKELQTKAEEFIKVSNYIEAIKAYDQILGMIRPNTQRWNRFKSAKLDCQNKINLQ